MHASVAVRKRKSASRYIAYSFAAVVVIFLCFYLSYFRGVWKRLSLPAGAPSAPPVQPALLPPLAPTAASSPGKPEAVPLALRGAPPGPALASIYEGAGAAVPYHGPAGVASGGLLEGAARRELLALANAPGVPSWTLTARQSCDVELLLNGGFSPLQGFMEEGTYLSVVQRMRLGNSSGYGDALWPMPITLDIPEALAEALSSSSPMPPAAAAALPAHLLLGSEGGGGGGRALVLKDEFNGIVGVLVVGAGGGPWRPDKAAEATAVFGTQDSTHPGVAHLLHASHEYYIGGRLLGLQMPQHYDFPALRLTPAQVRARIRALGWARTLAFQTRNPMHRAHIELVLRAARDARAGVLLHPVVGLTKPGDVEYTTRVACYQAIMPGGGGGSGSSGEGGGGDGESGDYFTPGGVFLALLPLAMRMGGPREALWHAIIRKNHGATHFVIGRDHAGVKSGTTGKDFYAPSAAADLVQRHAGELGMGILTYPEFAYVPSRGAYLPWDAASREGLATLALSGTALREALAKGTPVPPWFSDARVLAILRRAYPPLHARGFALLFTGLSGGGKSTVTRALTARLAGVLPGRALTVLDGDVVRAALSAGLGFTLRERDVNVERLGWVAGEVVRHGGIAIAAPIAPGAAARGAFCRAVEGGGGEVGGLPCGAPCHAPAGGCPAGCKGAVLCRCEGAGGCQGKPGQQRWRRWLGE